jgi:uncharacterized protein
MHSATANEPPQRIASRLHLAIFLWVNLWIAFGEGRSLRWLLSTQDPDTFHFRVVCCYVIVFIWEWILLAYVWFGVRKTGMSLRTLIGGRWTSFGGIAKDVGIGVVLWLLWMIGMYLYALLASASGPQQHIQDIVRAMLPRTGLDLTFWIVMSVAAGFCEEIVFRGYLLRQFHAMSNSMPVAVIGQALLFGVVHSYQGIAGVIVVSFFGLSLGCVAAWRRSLRPGLITHAIYDALIGIIMYLAYLHYQPH